MRGAVKSQQGICQKEIAQLPEIIQDMNCFSPFQIVYEESIQNFIRQTGLTNQQQIMYDP
jgi:hypothetical protein